MIGCRWFATLHRLVVHIKRNICMNDGRSIRSICNVVRTHVRAGVATCNSFLSPVWLIWTWLFILPAVCRVFYFEKCKSLPLTSFLQRRFTHICTSVISITVNITITSTAIPSHDCETRNKLHIVRCQWDYCCIFQFFGACTSYSLCCLWLEGVVQWVVGPPFLHWDTCVYYHLILYIYAHRHTHTVTSVLTHSFLLGKSTFNMLNSLTGAMRKT